MRSVLSSYTVRPLEGQNEQSLTKRGDHVPKQLRSHGRPLATLVEPINTKQTAQWRVKFEVFIPGSTKILMISICTLTAVRTLKSNSTISSSRYTPGATNCRTQWTPRPRPRRSRSYGGWLTRTEPRFLGTPARILATVTTEISHMLMPNLKAAHGWWPSPHSDHACRLYGRVSGASRRAASNLGETRLRGTANTRYIRSTASLHVSVGLC
jgi:hypothetical protein